MFARLDEASIHKDVCASFCLSCVPFVQRLQGLTGKHPLPLFIQGQIADEDFLLWERQVVIESIEPVFSFDTTERCSKLRLNALRLLKQI